MIEPLPNCFSIAATASSIAFCFSGATAMERSFTYVNRCV